MYVKLKFYKCCSSIALIPKLYLFLLCGKFTLRCQCRDAATLNYLHWINYLSFEQSAQLIFMNVFEYLHKSTWCFGAIRGPMQVYVLDTIIVNVSYYTTFLSIQTIWCKLLYVTNVKALLNINKWLYVFASMYILLRMYIRSLKKTNWLSIK